MEKVYNPRCRGGLARWGQGNYTLIRDDDQEQAEYALDLRICFNVSSGEESEVGGQTVYIARGEDEELVTVTPEENTLSLVYRYVGATQQILRLVNVSWGAFWKYICCGGRNIPKCVATLILSNSKRSDFSSFVTNTSSDANNYIAT